MVLKLHKPCGQHGAFLILLRRREEKQEEEKNKLPDRLEELYCGEAMKREFPMVPGKARMYPLQRVRRIVWDSGGLEILKLRPSRNRQQKILRAKGWRGLSELCLLVMTGLVFLGTYNSCSLKESCLWKIKPADILTWKCS